MNYGWNRLIREEKIVIFLLNEKYDQTEELLKGSPSINYNLLREIAFYNRVAPLILERLLNHFSSLLPKGIIKAYRLYTLQQITMNKMHRIELAKATNILTEAGYDVTLMKGLSYDPTEKIPRVYSDIDILIEEEKVLDVIDLMLRKGYSYKGSFILSREEKKNIENQLSWNNQYQFGCPCSHDTIEIHTNLFERDRIRLEDLTVLLDNPQIYKRNRIWNDELHCYIPSPEATLLLLCLQCSLKRSLYNNRFILRHIADMDILFTRGINGEIFVTMCRDSHTSLHTVFTIKLWSIIRHENLPSWFLSLEKELSPKDRYVVHRHLMCMKNLRSSSRTGRLFYNFTAPFIIGGSTRQRYTWLRNNFLPTKVEQENRYHRWGFKKESPLIYLTYLINPFQTSWRFIKKILGIKDSSSLGS